MKKIINELYKETYYTEVLDNGLTVIIFHKPEYVSSIAAFGSRYGALNIHQKVNDKEYNFNPGIAHFLEHKLFETDDKDIMNDFSKIGANVNAFTSYLETVYYFSTNNDIEKPLNMLMDFVQDFSVASKSVEKEKGIIIEEVSMYLEEPSSRLLNETYKAMYKNYPLKYDIGGNSDSVKAITQEELEECYAINYHPNNMVLLVASSKDPDEIMKIIKDNQAKKHFAMLDRPKDNNLEEPLEVFKENHEFKMDVSCDKHVIAYKLKPNFKSNEEAFLKQTALTLLLDACFSPVNPLYQKWLDEGKINEFFGYELDFNVNHSHILFFLESDDDKALEEVIKEGLKVENINEELLEELKRKYIGIGFSNINQLESFALDYLRDYLEGMDFFKEIEIIKAISLDDVKNSIHFVDNSSISKINMRKK